MRLAVDTNVLLSGLFWRGTASQFLETLVERNHVLLMTVELIKELEGVARRVAPSLDLELALEGMRASWQLVLTKRRVEVIRDDESDNRVLECALEGKADLIVSGDRHLLALGTFEGIPILTIRRALERV